MSERRIRTLIADDEPLARQGVRQLLAAEADIEVVGEARDGREAAKLVGELAPDLIFLDVKMPEVDAFDLLQDVPQRKRPDVILVTAFDHFAVRAFEAQVSDYLVKPVSAARFADAVARARLRIRLNRSWLGDDDRAGPDREAPFADKIVVSGDGVQRLIDHHDVYWIEAYDYYVVVHAQGRRHLLRRSIESMEHVLADRGFVRTHRSALINVRKICAIRRSTQGSDLVELADGSTAPLSRRRRQTVLRLMRSCGC